MKTVREYYEEWITPKLVSNTIEILQKEIPKYKGKISSGHLCFTTDPFMYGYEDVCNCSMQIIKLLNENKIACTALTKGLLPVGLSNLSKENQYGITLISLNESYRERIEPGASPYEDRIKSLKALHEMGCKTWVSIEPYPTPNILEQDLLPILNAVDFVDKIIFGRTNYNAQISKFKNFKLFYNHLSKQVIDFCNSKNIGHHIKEGTMTDFKECGCA